MLNSKTKLLINNYMKFRGKTIIYSKVRGKKIINIA